MSIRKLAVAAGIALCLSACGDSPDKACFDTADHASLSDGKIKGMCDCAVSKTALALTSERDKDILALLIRNKQVPPNEAGRAKEVAIYWGMALSSCRSK